MKRSIIISFFVLAAAGLAVYAGSLGNGFCYDENIVILGNDHVQKDGQLTNILTGTYWGTAAEEQNIASWGYRPLTILSYYATRKLGGNDPFWFHLFNVLAHVGCTLLLFLLLVRLEFPHLLAFLSSALFVLHSIHTEAAAQIVGRAELIAAFFVLLALVIHCETFKGSGKRKLLPAAAAACACFIGILAKEGAASFIFMAFCVDLYAMGHDKGLKQTLKTMLKRRWMIYLLYLVPVIVFILVRWSLLGRPFPTFDVHFVDNPLAALPVWVRPLGAAVVFGKVLLLMLLPVSLSADYGYNQIPVDAFYATFDFYFGLLAFVAVTAAVFRWRRKAPEAFFGWLVFILVYFPVSNVPFLIHTILGERVLYLPSIGFCVFLAALLHHGWLSGKSPVKLAAVSAIAMLFLFHAGRTHVRNKDWKDDLTLFAATAKVSDNSVRVLNNSGNVKLIRGDMEGAEKSYRKALAIFPEYDDAAVNLAGVMIRKRRADAAIALLNEVLDRRPDHSMALDSYRIALELKKKGAKPK